MTIKDLGTMPDVVDIDEWVHQQVTRRQGRVTHVLVYKGVEPGQEIPPTHWWELEDVVSPQFPDGKLIYVGTEDSFKTWKRSMVQ